MYTVHIEADLVRKLVEVGHVRIGPVTKAQRADVVVIEVTTFRGKSGDEPGSVRQGEYPQEYKNWRACKQSQCARRLLVQAT
jgi:hypothetical protein